MFTKIKLADGSPAYRLEVWGTRGRIATIAEIEWAVTYGFIQEQNEEDD